MSRCTACDGLKTAEPTVHRTLDGQALEVEQGGCSVCGGLGHFLVCPACLGNSKYAELEGLTCSLCLNTGEVNVFEHKEWKDNHCAEPRDF